MQTAVSGRVDALREVYLSLDYGDVVGRAEARTNIAYLTGIDEAALERRIETGLAGLALSASPEADRARLDDILPDAPPALRLLVENALLDAAARRAGASVATVLAGAPAPLASRTNQTLFLAPDDVTLARAEAYAARGFLDLKLRMGAGAPADDLRRARALRDRLGARLALSVDANGRWDRETARRMADALFEIGADYVEQPLPADDLDGLAALARGCRLGIMLDESVGTLACVARALDIHGGFLVHLKLAKLGGLDRLMAAARLAESRGAGVMVGQMNEGALATAAALAAAAAIRPAHAELYGADGLVDDPFEGLRYGEGRVEAGGPTGFGVEPRAGSPR